MKPPTRAAAESRPVVSVGYALGSSLLLADGGGTPGPGHCHSRFAPPRGPQRALARAHVVVSPCTPREWHTTTLFCAVPPSCPPILFPSLAYGDEAARGETRRPVGENVCSLWHCDTQNRDGEQTQAPPGEER